MVGLTSSQHMSAHFLFSATDPALDEAEDEVIAASTDEAEDTPTKTEAAAEFSQQLSVSLLLLSAADWAPLISFSSSSEE